MIGSSSGVRIIAGALALTVAVVPAPAAATPPSNVIAIPPGQRDGDGRVVGPEELRDFRIGNPPAERPAPSPPESQRPAPADTRTATPPSATPPAPTTQPRTAAPTSVAPIPLPNVSATDSAAARETPTFRIDPPADGAVRTASPSAAPRAIEPRPLGAEAAASASATGAAGPSWWLLLLLPLGALAAGWFALRRRPRPALADGADVPAPPIAPRDTAPLAPKRSNPFDGLGSPPAPRVPSPVRPTAPAPTTAASTPASAGATGIISTQLRPRLEMRVEPLRAAIESDAIWMDCRILLANTGSASAYDLRIDTVMVNAGPDQDEAIEAVFGAPRQGGDTPALRQLSPGQQVELRGRAQRSLAETRVLQAADRRIVAPLLALRLTRASRPGGQPSEVEVQRHFVGRAGAEDGRLAPWRVDRGPRLIRNPLLKPA